MLCKINKDHQEKIHTETVTSGYDVGGPSRLVVDGKAKILWLFWEILSNIIIALKNKE